MDIESIEREGESIKAEQETSLSLIYTSSYQL